MAGRLEWTDEQWELLEPVLRALRRTDNRGRPWIKTRDVLNGVLWVLGTGAQWAEMPEKYPAYQTCHRRFHAWAREGKFVEALWNGSLPGCTTSEDSPHDGNTTSRTSSASCNSLLSSYCSDIYEMDSSVIRATVFDTAR